MGGVVGLMFQRYLLLLYGISVFTLYRGFDTLVCIGIVYCSAQYGNVYVVGPLLVINNRGNEYLVISSNLRVVFDY